MSSPPPPPPPHGEAPKTTAGGGSGLPPGKYDVFIIPEHSAGSGFLYLPSLRTNTNSFIAGFASALILVVLGQSMAPAFQAWWANFQGMGNAGMLLLVIAVGLGAWSLGRQQSTDSPGQGGADGGFYSGGGASMPGGGGFSSAGSSPRSAHPGSTPNGGPPPNAHSQAPPGGSQPSANKANGSYQRPPPQTQARPQSEPEPEPQPEPKPKPPPPPQPSAAKPQAETPKNAWEKAREEVRRNEEERKARQADEKRRAEAAARLKELREKEAKERAAREAEKARREADTKEKAEKEAKEARAKELRERLVREREDRRKKLEEEKKRKEEEASESRKSSAYAYSGVGEKTNPWPTGKPPTASPQAGRSPSPTKKPPAPTARTFVGTEEEAYSYRPYDQPKRPAGRRMSNSDVSESSWAPSQSTARTTPPPSVRGPYSTKDPDKIVIKAVYCFMNQYAKTPASQLISGVGSVTDGLILRITTEGLFIDDDVRGVAQREWDVKAWTLKNVEVWCPVHFLACAIAANSPPSPTSATPPASVKNLSTAFFAKTMGGSARLRAAERGTPKTLSGDDADTYLTKMLASCKDSCRLGDCASKFGGTNPDDASSVTSGSTRTDSTTQTGDWKAKGLHLLRATIRDQDGKRYMFVIGEDEGWKVAVGLQRLRKGTQVRALGVAGLSGIDTKNTLEMLGWG